MPIFSMAIIFAIAFLFVMMIQIQVFEIAFAKLGLSPQATLGILLGSLLGSAINLPIFKMKTENIGHWIKVGDQKLVWELFKPARAGYVIVAINLGGCIIPVGLCLYFLSQQLLNPLHILIALSMISALSYKLSQPVAGVGIGMPILIAPLTAAGLALLLDPSHAAHLAYISGVLGVLIGADILHLKSVNKLGAPIAAIGGAGSFDGIFMTGIIAALLA
ncbi:MAG: DUF1614 domain-containing protein [Methylomonas sp.]